MPDGAITGQSILTSQSVAEFRRGAIDNGWPTIPVRTRDKAPHHRNWQQGVSRELQLSPQPDALNTGALTAGLRAVDIDVDDPALAAQVRARIENRLGGTAARTRVNSPRSLLIYRAEHGEPAKLVCSGMHGKIEVLGKGQQFVAHGLHPSGVAYAWEGDRGPHNTAPAELPAVTEQQLMQVLDDVAPLLGQPAGGHSRGAKLRHVGTLAPGGLPGTPPARLIHTNLPDLLARMTKQPESEAGAMAALHRTYPACKQVEQIRAIISGRHLDSIAHGTREEWFKGGVALGHAAQQASEQAEREAAGKGERVHTIMGRLWHKLSQRDPEKYDPADCDRVLRDYRPGGPITTQFLFATAIRNRYDTSPHLRPPSAPLATVVAGAAGGAAPDLDAGADLKRAALDAQAAAILDGMREMSAAEQQACVGKLARSGTLESVAPNDGLRGFRELADLIAAKAEAESPGGGPTAREMTKQLARQWHHRSGRLDSDFEEEWRRVDPATSPGGARTLTRAALENGLDPADCLPERLLPSIPPLPSAVDPLDATVGWANDDLIEFYYGGMLAPRYVTLLGAPGGTGKSAFSTGIAACIATGQSLLGEQVSKRLSVLMLNLEDGRAKVRRGVKACALHHGIRPAALRGRLFTAGVDDIPDGLRLITINPTTRREEVDQVKLTWLRNEIRKRKIAVLIIDPLSRLIRGNENSNEVGDMLMEQLTRLAVEERIAILVVQHTRKNGGGIIGDGVAALRGASTMPDGARGAYGCVRMALDKAAALGFQGTHPPIDVHHLTSNLGPPDDVAYYEIVPVKLPGGAPNEPAQIERGRWAHTVKRIYPPANGGITDVMLEAAMRVLDAGTPDKNDASVPFAPKTAGGKSQRDPIPAIAAALKPMLPPGAPGTATAERVLRELSGRGYVSTHGVKLPSYRTGRDGVLRMNGSNDGRGLACNWSLSPWSRPPTTAARQESEEEKHKSDCNSSSSAVPSTSSTSPHSTATDVLTCDGMTGAPGATSMARGVIGGSDVDVRPTCPPPSRECCDSSQSA